MYSYHIALNNWPRIHHFHPSPGRWDDTETYGREVFDWCRDQFGEPHTESRDGRWVAHGYSHFWFRDENDVFAFKMRWL